MRLISHRGNINGPRPEKENEPAYIQGAIALGYDVEIDVWNIGGNWFLGHDEPTYSIDIEFLRDERLLCHATNLPALHLMINEEEIHCFWHQEDHYTITSENYILSYPGYSTSGKDTICMKAEYHDLNTIKNCYAVCSDYIIQYKEEM